MREAAEMSNATSDYFAAPLEDNLFEWHFTVRGPEDTEFQVKIRYHEYENKYDFVGRYLSWAHHSASRVPYEATRYHCPHSKDLQIFRYHLFSLKFCSLMADLKLARRFVSLFLVSTLRLGSPPGP